MVFHKVQFSLKQFFLRNTPQVKIAELKSVKKRFVNGMFEIKVVYTKLDFKLTRVFRNFLVSFGTDKIWREFSPPNFSS